MKYYNSITEARLDEIMEALIGKELKVEDYIKEGYLYRINGHFIVVTGYKGVLDYINNFAGIPLTYILQYISVTKDDTIRTNTEWIPVLEAKWNKKKLRLIS